MKPRLMIVIMLALLCLPSCRRNSGVRDGIVYAKRETPARVFLGSTIPADYEISVYRDEPNGVRLTRTLYVTRQLYDAARIGHHIAWRQWSDPPPPQE